ncbi:hypothetical protein BH11PLA2_BH11PLA2_50260 [soil metagenome]
MIKEITEEQVGRLPWFQELEKLIVDDMTQARADSDLRRPTFEKEITDCKAAMSGLAQTISKPDLHTEVRVFTENELLKVSQRQRKAEDGLQALQFQSESSRVTLNPAEIVSGLNRLSELLAGENATRTNIELSRHIDSIRCYPDGRVVIRVCKFGAFYVEQFEKSANARAVATTGKNQTHRAPRPRRRSARQLTSDDAGPELRDIADRATDIDRFAGLDDDWFWEDTLTVPGPTCWSKENAMQVAALREKGWSQDRLARHFNVQPSTIRNALDFALEADPSLKLVKRVNSGCWQDTHYEEVAAMKHAGQSVREIATHYGVSGTLVQWALKLAKAKAAAVAEAEGLQVVINEQQMKSEAQ